MLSIKDLHDYQNECVNHQIENNDSMLWLQMGLGKTVITLTTIARRIRRGEVKKVLIFAPLRVVQSVWVQESKKWLHTHHLKFRIIQGTQEQRKNALLDNSQIYLINYECMNWIAEELEQNFVKPKRDFPFQMVVYDEVSRLKNSASLRMAGGHRDRKHQNGRRYPKKIIGWRTLIKHFKYRLGLTGTPASNGYLDLHGQFLAVDGGKRLGAYITHYKSNFFSSDFNGWSFRVTHTGRAEIENSIADITKKMDSAEYLDLPSCKTTNLMVELPKNARKAYQDIEKQLFAHLDSGNSVEVMNRSSISNKCLQICNGSPYLVQESDKKQNYDSLHMSKLDALAEVVEMAQGAPVLCSYSFRSDAERIMDRFKQLRPVNLTATKASLTESIISRWNQGSIKLLIGHPASMGHGVDGLQFNGSIIVWFGLNWSLELYSQMNGRLLRQGQKRPVTIIRILCKDTIDLAVADSIERKCNDQEGLKSAIERYRDGHTDNDISFNFF
jgi:SNF2 family DNA or RNA helicase